MSERVTKYDMGIIGNCSYLAYIDTVAQVKWLCMPRFDSSFIFGSLLDAEKGGIFGIIPMASDFSTEQYYLKNTNVLCTEFKTESGVFKVTDCAPRFYHFERYFKPLMLIRKVEPISGEPRIKVVCKPVGEYGSLVPQTVIGSNHIRYLNLEQQVRLTTDIPVNYVVHETLFILNEVKYLVFTFGEPLEAPLAVTAEEFIQKTKRYWVQWVKSTSIPSIYQEEVIRSALVLKLHQYEDTGGIIAAGTTSLPEIDGSGRTWDYRYCWIRDAFYTLNAFSSIGHFEELEKYFYYIENIVFDEKERIQPVYGIAGEKILTEKELPLAGYRGNKPVRIGNDAFLQNQNDVYGHLLACLLPLYLDQRLEKERHQKKIHLVWRLLNSIEKTMEIPDAGIWEFRNKKQFHCYTYLFHWAGSKAAYKIGKALQDVSLMTKANKLTELSSRKIEECYDEERGVYTQAIHVSYLDASALQLITMRYLDPCSERAKMHLIKLENELATPEGLFYRYKHEDHLGQTTAAFLICSFWYVESLACVGRIDDAQRVLEMAIKSMNHLGLLSEDTDAAYGQWGNFPQTYSHIGLINAVYRIEHAIQRPYFY